jgi:hypothetical protein
LLGRDSNPPEEMMAIRQKFCRFAITGQRGVRAAVRSSTTRSFPPSGVRGEAREGHTEASCTLYRGSGPIRSWSKLLWASFNPEMAIPATEGRWKVVGLSSSVSRISSALGHFRFLPRSVPLHPQALPFLTFTIATRPVYPSPHQRLRPELPTDPGAQ